MGHVIPPYGHGRQVYIAKHLKVTQEAVRKWFTGEARPRVAKMRELALLLEVDEAWLALGVEPEMDRKEKRLHNSKTEGSIYLLFGMFTLAGGHCAFPGDMDSRKDYVDFYTIIHGKQLAIHVSTGRETTRGRYEFIVPREYDDVRCVGIVHHGGIRFHVIDLKNETIATHKQRKGGGYVVTMGLSNNVYQSGPDTWPRIKHLGDL